MSPQWEWACDETERARNLRERGLERYHDGRFQGAKCYLTDAKNVCSYVVNSLSSMRNYDDADEIFRDASTLLHSIAFKLIECCVRLVSDVSDLFHSEDIHRIEIVVRGRRMCWFLFG